VPSRIRFFGAVGVFQALLAVLLIRAEPCGNRPDHLAVLMLTAFVHAGVTGITRDLGFFSMAQLIDWRHIRRRADQAMH
jgi:hypothetical protein